MEAFFFYILKFSVCLTVFYICFKALLSNDTFFWLNRSVLLFGVLACMFLPLIEIETKEVSLIQQPVMQIERIFFPVEDDIMPMTEALHLPQNGNESISWISILCFFYFAGIIFCFLTLIISLYRMFDIIRNGHQIKRNKYTIVLISQPIAPFSWGKYIILSEEDYQNNPEEILIHEEQHLQYRHSLDLLLMEVVVLLNWFNPTIWLLKRELKEIHEYQADKGVLKRGINATKYQLLLVKKAVGSSHYTLANSFNHSKIKKRITMMLKKQSNKWARLKLLLLVPIGALVLQAFARPSMQPEMLNLFFQETQGETFSPSMNKSTIIIEGEQEKQPDFYFVFVLDENEGSREKTVKSIRMEASEYNSFKAGCIQTSASKEGLRGAKGKIAKSRGYFKDSKGEDSMTETLYHELTTVQEKDLMSRTSVAPPPPLPIPPTVKVTLHYDDTNVTKSFQMYANTPIKELEEGVQSVFDKNVNLTEIDIEKGVSHEYEKEVLDMLAKVTSETDRTRDCQVRVTRKTD